MPLLCRAPATALALALLAAFAAASPSARATCRCGGGRLEVVFVLDASASMHLMIGTVKEQFVRITKILEGRFEDVRVGIVAYKTDDPRVDFRVRTFPLSHDRAGAIAFLRSLHAEGGGYELVAEALEAAIERAGWTKGARKVLILAGDEGPAPERTKDVVRLARLARERGILVNAVTCSETAWTYWANAHRAEWEKLFAEYGERLKRTFQIPVFADAARAGGGLSVAASDTRELARWLLAMPIGLDAKTAEKIDVRAALSAADEVAKKEPAEPGQRPLMAQLTWRGLRVPPHDADALLTALKKRVVIDADVGVERLRSTDERLARRPLLFVTGHEAIRLSPEEKGALRRYLAGGGTILASACCGSKEFDASFRRLAQEILPGAKLSPLAPDHPIYHTGYRIERVRYTAAHRSRALVEGRPRMEGASLDGRLAILYSPQSLGSGWRTWPLSPFCDLHDEDALRLTVNAVLYVMQE